MKNAFEHYDLGLTDYRELCFALTQSKHPLYRQELRHLDKLLAEVYDSEEYWELRKEFDHKVNALLQSNKEIDQIVTHLANASI